MWCGNFCSELNSFSTTGQWNPKVTVLNSSACFLHPDLGSTSTPHIFSAVYSTHEGIQGSCFLLLFGLVLLTPGDHAPLEMAHLSDGRHGYFPQRLPALSSWVTMCRVQLTLEAFPPEMASNPGVATGSCSLPAEHVRTPANWKGKNNKTFINTLMI